MASGGKESERERKGKGEVGVEGGGEESGGEEEGKWGQIEVKYEGNRKHTNVLLCYTVLLVCLRATQDS
jgi:hypothetical protein